MKFKITLIVVFSLITVSSLFSQTQDDFNTQLSEIYMNAGDAEKARDLANELYRMEEKNNSLKSLVLKSFCNFSSFPVSFA